MEFMGANYYDYFTEYCTGELYNEAVLMEAEKEGVFKDNYIFRDELQNVYVHDTLAKQSTQDKLIEFTGEFIDKHARELSTAGPVLSFVFGDNETKFLYELFNTNSQFMLDLYDKVVKETYYGSISKFFTGWIQHAPHKILMVAMLIDALQNEYTDVVECCKYLWAFCEYPIVFRDSWTIGVKEDVMAYTMEHLGSKYKYVQKKMKTLGELLKFHADVSVANQAERLKTGADNTYMDFMYRLRNQMTNSFQNIANAYYINYKNGNTLHQRNSTFDDGSLAEQEGHTTSMTQIIDKTINKFLTNTINDGMVKIAADNVNVDKSNLRGYISQIMATKGNRIDEFIEGIITAYFTKNPTNSELNKSEFIGFGLALYKSLSGSKDVTYSTLRTIIDFWVNDIIHIHDHYSTGVAINYTRAIFNYMVLMIMYYN